ncbi:MAG: radical SAM protein, partial [Chloroflexi bacterium]|nr:radical SAM protein [Chloroflexota bacterium]
EQSTATMLGAEDAFYQRAAGLLRGAARPGWGWALPAQGRYGVIVLNEQALRALDAFAQPRRLAEVSWSGGDLEAIAADLIAAGALASFPTLDAASTCLECDQEGKRDFLTVWLQLTDACPLRCSYCYVEKGRTAIDLESVRRVVDKTFRSALLNGFSGVRLKYAGGEPLANWDALLEAHRYAAGLAAKFGFNFEAVVLTSGVGLTQSIANQLRQLGIRAALSLDGVGATQDAQRPLANGRGSFASVNRSLEWLLLQDIPTSVTVTLTAKNLASLPETVAYLLERKLSFSLNFYRGQAHLAHDPLALDTQELIAALRGAFEVIEKDLPQFRLTGILDRAHLDYPHQHPCGAGSAYWSVGANGDELAACPMELGAARHRIDELDALIQPEKPFHGLENPKVDDKAGCRECDWRYWCAGGCPTVTRRASGSPLARSPFCAVYQTLLPELARLEALRILKQHSLYNL